ncbi:hypothetical protein CEXT_735891 [Caerostris extrusa]|uniref:Uncharacterized protein n=1 Tax=Caerostris extrusa TaxID=172846 RepID=A0AAV4Y2J3_CAEEX|nr:hypothetical protein CEXT_735891 [Caerostris extrusa]
MRTQSMHIDEQQLPKELSFPPSAAKILMLRPSVSSFAPITRRPHVRESGVTAHLPFGAVAETTLLEPQMWKWQFHS